jgi:antibiotic biosynthesis monooxygenase (ABM) superfamily enzyme
MFILLLSCNGLQAQTSAANADAETAQEAAAPRPQPNHRKARLIHPAEPARNLQFRENASAEVANESGWDRILSEKMAPQRPNRPIPAILGLIGAALILIWSGLLVGAIVTEGTAALILLISTLVLSPLVIIGIIFVIGALVAAFSGGEKRQKKAAKAAPEPVE